MKYNIVYDEKEYKLNYIVKALENGEWVQFKPKGYETWVNIYSKASCYLKSGQLNFVEYDFRIMTKEFSEFLMKSFK